VEIRRELDDHGVLTVTMDDGDKNALVPAVFEGLIAVLDEEADARAIVLAGREGILTAGLNVKWMAANGREGVEQLLVLFGRCLVRWWTDPRPTVCAATGHAIAAGTMFGMACDHTVAADGGFWGLTETRIDFEIPEFGIALARHNVRADRLEDLLLPGERVDAATAVDAGFADEVVALDQVRARARGGGEGIVETPPPPPPKTKQRLRGSDAEAVLAGLDADIAALTAHLG
jgi:enoyl-CoA hydratase